MNPIVRPLPILALTVTVLALAACGVRGALVKPETGDVLIETSGSRADRPADTASGEAAEEEDGRFPAPEAVK